MQLTDTHCHIHEALNSPLGEPELYAMWQKSDITDPDELIAEAKQAGVTRLICVGTSVNDSRMAVDFVQNKENCWASIGIHPHDAKLGEAAFKELGNLVPAKKVVAVGECGLDYFYSHSPKQDQMKALRFQIELAQTHNLPLIFHVRDAFDDFWPVFDSYSGLRGVLHSFTDSYANMEKAIDRGLFIGVNGIMTFTKDPVQLAMAKAIPLQKLLIETDAPFLTPKPLRGKVNKPANAMLVAKFLAELRGESFEDLTTHTTRNSQTLFNL